MCSIWGAILFSKLDASRAVWIYRMSQYLPFKSLSYSCELRKKGLALRVLPALRLLQFLPCLYRLLPRPVFSGVRRRQSPRRLFLCQAEGSMMQRWVLDLLDLLQFHTFSNVMFRGGRMKSHCPAKMYQNVTSWQGNCWSVVKKCHVPRRARVLWVRIQEIQVGHG